MSSIPGIPDDYRPSKADIEARLAPLFANGRAPRIPIMEAIYLAEDLGATALAIDLRCALYVMRDTIQDRTIGVASLVKMAVLKDVSSAYRDPLTGVLYALVPIGSIP